MFDLDSIQSWFQHNCASVTSDTQGAYWVIKREDKSIVAHNYTIADPSESWNYLRDNILGEVDNGGRYFKVFFKRNLKDADNKCPSRVLKVPYSSTSNSAIAGTAQQHAVGSISNVQLFEQRMAEMERRSEMQLEFLKKEFEYQTALRLMEDEVEALKHAKKSNLDRIIEAMGGAPTVLDRVLGFMDKRAPAIAVSGAEQVKEVPAANEATPQQSLNFNEPIQAFINLQQNGITEQGAILRLADATIRMKKSGYQDAVSILERIVIFCRDNPSTAQSLLSQLNNETT